MWTWKVSVELYASWRFNTQTSYQLLISMIILMFAKGLAYILKSWQIIRSTEFWILGVPKKFTELKFSIFRDWFSWTLDPIHVWAKVSKVFQPIDSRVSLGKRNYQFCFYLNLPHLQFRCCLIFTSILQFINIFLQFMKKSGYSPIPPI